jgi:antitoxin component HigA of HigAB toxin-antitoxin module
VLNRKRSLNLQMIRALHRHFGMPYASLIEQTEAAPVAG